MNKFLLAGVASIATLSATASADAPTLSSDAQDVVRLALVHKLVAALKATASDYNKHLKDVTYFENLIKKGGAADSELRAMKDELGKSWLLAREKVTWQDGEIVLKSGQITAKINIDDALDSTIRINEKAFRFDDARPLSETVTELRKAIRTASSGASLNRGSVNRFWAMGFASLVTSAFADDKSEDFYIETKLASTMLSLHYSVARGFKVGQELVGLNTALQSELAKCRSSDPQDYAARHDRLSRTFEDTEALIASVTAANHSEHPTLVTHHRIASCDDLAAYASSRTYKVRVYPKLLNPAQAVPPAFSDMAPTYDDVHPTFPENLCSNLNALQACLKDKTADQVKAIEDADKAQVKRDEAGHGEVKAGLKVNPDGSTQPVK